MGRHSSWNVSGLMTQADVNKWVNSPGIGVQGVLVKTGQYAVKEMREITKKTDASHELTDSIMFITARNKSGMGSASPSENALDAPSDNFTMFAGSGAPHAIYRETFSGIHKTADGSQEFIASLKEWCKLVLKFDPDDGTSGSFIRFSYLLKEIRDHDTPGNPFIEPNKEKVLKFGLKRFRYSLGKFLKSVGANRVKGGTS